jgi:ATP-dependent exoDNAse (exonuclease V) alpha subunit
MTGRRYVTMNISKKTKEVNVLLWLNRQPLNMHQPVTVAGMSKKHTGKLPGQLELVVGMKAMVTMNIATEADLANGTRGEIIDIVLDPMELDPRRDEETSIMEGLPDGVIPIFPSEIKFNIPHQGQTIRHLPTITAGYAFTDYKSQGQTIECVIVDLGKPPWEALTAFNTYTPTLCQCEIEVVLMCT